MNFETHTYQLVIAVLGGRGPPAKQSTETLPHTAVRCQALLPQPTRNNQSWLCRKTQIVIPNGMK